MNNWCKNLFNTEQPIIAMCHLYPMPGDPNYDEKKGVDWIFEKARSDLHALQDGGVDGILFSNERSQPWMLKAEAITPATMACVIGQLKSEITVPFGVDVIWDPMASIELAVATNAKYIREVFTGAYASDYGIWNTNIGETMRRRRALNGQDIKLLFNVTPEAAAYLGDRTLSDIVKTTVFNGSPDALCVSGITASEETSLEDLAIVKKIAPDVTLFANTGVTIENVEQQLSIANGAVIGSHFKTDGYIWNDVDAFRVKKFMEKVRSFRER